MTLYNCPSPKNTNNAGLYLTNAGHLVDRHGRSWGRSSMARLAMDALPSSARDLPQPELNEAQRGEIDEDERVRALCHELEVAMEKLNLRPEYAGALLKVIEQHKKHDWKTSGDAAPDHEGLRAFLRGKGLDEESLEKVFDIIESAGEEEEPSGKDVLPVAGPLHRLLARQTREPGGKTFEFPEENLSPRYEPPESERPMTSRDRRQARDLAMDANKADRFADVFGTHFAEIGIGDPWRSRR